MLWALDSVRTTDSSSGNDITQPGFSLFLRMAQCVCPCCGRCLYGAVHCIVSSSEFIHYATSKTFLCTGNYDEGFGRDQRKSNWERKENPDAPKPTTPSVKLAKEPTSESAPTPPPTPIAEDVQPEPEPESTVEQVSTPEPTAEPVSQPNPEPAVEPVSEPTPEPTEEPVSTPEPVLTPEPAPAVDEEEETVDDDVVLSGTDTKVENEVSPS